MITFENESKLDPLAFQLMGIHSKECDNPIGHFGTGLKYAIAILLRTKTPFIIQSYGETYRFTTREQNFRGEVLHQVVCNDVPLGFTTKLGEHWTLEHAFRELYCNTLDEGGIVRKKPRYVDTSNATVITVHGMLKEYESREDMFLHGKKPLYTSSRCDVYTATAHNHAVFYRQIRVNYVEEPTCFIYSVNQGVELTEDRTVTNMSSYDAVVRNMWLACEDKALLQRLFAAPEGSYEAQLNFMSYLCNEPCASFVEALQDYYAEGRPLKNESLYQKLKSLRPKAEPRQKDLTVSEQAIIDEAVELLRKGGYNIDAYPIIKTHFEDSSVWAQAENGKIMLSQTVIDLGGRDLASTLLEEFFHLRYSFQDCNRRFQTFLHEQIVRQLKRK